MREQALEERLVAIVDSQAKDIAFDFTSLDSKLNDLRDFVDG